MEKLKMDLKYHKLSLLIRLIVNIAAILTVGVLIAIVVYILYRGIPNITPQMFEAKYTSENASVVPALINTLITIVVTLLIAVPIGIFSAVYMTEYAKRGNKLVKVVRLMSETLSGIPSIVFGLFGYLFFVVACKFDYSLLAGSLTLAIMVLPTIMTTTEEALRSIPDSYREGSFGLGAGKLRIPCDPAISNSRNPGRCHSFHRKNYWRNRCTYLYGRFCCKSTGFPDGLRTYPGSPYVCTV